MASNQPSAKIEKWSSRFTFLVASIGFSVGLGNIWRFPYVAGENGGSAFILLYLICALGIGVPLIMAEWAIGRRTKHATSATGSFREAASDSNLSSKWAGVGGMAVIAVFMLMLTYTVITGWTMEYFIQSITGTFSQVVAIESKGIFEDLMANPWRLIFWHTLVVIITVLINSRGVKGGIEKAVKILMPSLLVCMIVMVVYSWIVGDVVQATEFLLTPDFSQITGKTFLLALGQAFFSIGVGMAVMITYGSYLNKEISIAQNSFIVVFADTLVALIAGFAIFPLVFAHGLTPDTGAGLVFQVLPIAFGELPGGQIFGSIFFLLLISAALTSCIGNFEPIVTWASERFKISRIKAAMVSGGTIWLFGLTSIMSLSVWKDFYPFDFISNLQEKNIFDSFDFIAASILLPIGGLLTAIFVGWRLPENVMQDELGLSATSFKLWQILVRFVAPIAITVVFISGIT